MTTALAQHRPRDPKPQSGPRVWLPDLKPAATTWLAIRVETFLAHYWRDDDPATREAILADWIACLHGFPADAIGYAVAEWLDTEPRTRPRPGDVADICRRWIEARASTAKRDTFRTASLTAEQERVVAWAVESGRLDRGDAIEAVTSIGAIALPPWADTEAQKCVYAVRHHGRYAEPQQQPKPNRSREWRTPYAD
jgi:hypothetical protein